MSFLLNPFVFAGAAGDFESIATVTVGSGGASSIEFTSIPGTYQHLQVRLLGRSTRTSANNDVVLLTINGDSSSSNYAGHHLRGDGGAASAGAATSGTTYARSIYMVAGNTITSGIFGALVIDILDYANSSKNTVLRTFSGIDANGAGYVHIDSRLWINTSSVTSIGFDPQFGDWMQHSTAALYGIKA